MGDVPCLVMCSIDVMDGSGCLEGFWGESKPGYCPMVQEAFCGSTIDESFFCYALGPILLACVSNVLIFCYIWLVWTDYVYHRFAWHPYRTFPLSRYLAALDPLTHLGSPSYLSLHSHSRATPLAHLPLHQFWHAWVRSTAITKISSVAYSVPYQASVSPCSARWRIPLASCDSIFLWLGPLCIYSVCTRPESL